MGLKRILTPLLLPRDTRENILGDLQETGFRSRDCLTAVASAWISILRREFMGPIPRLADASDDAIRQRVAQLSGRNFMWSAARVGLVAYAMHSWFGLTGLGWVAGTLFCLAVFPAKGLELPPGRPLLDLYRFRLGARFLSLFAFVVMSLNALAVLGFSHKVQGGAILFTVIFFGYRGWRLMKEVCLLGERH